MTRSNSVTPSPEQESNMRTDTEKDILAMDNKAFGEYF